MDVKIRQNSIHFENSGGQQTHETWVQFLKSVHANFTDALAHQTANVFVNGKVKFTELTIAHVNSEMREIFRPLNVSDEMLKCISNVAVAEVKGMLNQASACVQHFEEVLMVEQAH